MDMPLSDKIKMLPPAIKNILDIPEVVDKINKIRERYDVAAGLIFVGLLARDIPVADLEKVLIDKHKIIPEEAKILAPELIDLLKLGCQLVGTNFIQIYSQPIVAPAPSKPVAPVSAPQPAVKKISESAILAPANPSAPVAPVKKIWQPVDVEKLTDMVVKKISLELDPILTKRLYKTVESYLKEVRNEIETKEVLTKPVKIGGLGLTEEKSEHIIKGLEEVEKRYHLDEQAKAQELKNPVVQQEEKLSRGFEGQPGAIRDQLKEIADSLETKAKEIKNVSPIKLQINDSDAGLEKSEKNDRMASVPIVPKSIGGDYRTKNKITDIQPPSHVMGPVEELRALSLTDWRRLGSIDQSVAKILNKTTLLREESFVKGEEGRKAWEQSEVYQLYIALGLESIQKKITLAQVIAERQKDNKITLTMEEFRAVMDLNKKLKY